MQISYKWLREYVDIDLPVREFSRAMTMSGSKVELWSSDADTLKNIVWGRIVSVEPHPNAEKLSVCMTDVGEKTVRILTAAKNVYAGATVPVCLDGAVLADGTEIKPTEMRGILSEGMFCSFRELGMSKNDVPYADEDGILILPESAAPGSSVISYFGLDDIKIEFEITPNRPDCLSVLGIAREAGATFKKPVRFPRPEIKNAVGNIGELLKVRIDAPELCKRYSSAVIRDITVRPSPDWMRERLRNAGVRPINNIVDITNYVMLEYGQPMHAFDFSRVKDGTIIVRQARKGESMTTLDDQKRELPEGALLITDPDSILGIAGVMGGQSSEITGNTRSVIFESAFFEGPSVRSTSAAIGLRTDASSRFEKGLDPENTMPALIRACELVEMLGAGTVVGGFIDVYPQKKTRRTVRLEPERIQRVLDAEISEDEMKDMLASLGFETDGRTVYVPSWRDDVCEFADILEEIARMYGYDKIGSSLLSGSVTGGGLNARQKFENALLDNAATIGYSEIKTWSFMGEKDLDNCLVPAVSPLRRAMRISNPLGEDQKFMRTTLIPSMMDCLARNHSFRVPSCRLIQIEPVYIPALKDGEADCTRAPEERKMMVLAGYGSMDFYSLRSDMERLLVRADIDCVTCVPERNDGFFHPGRCARLMCGDKAVGVMGQISPAIAENYGIQGEVYAAVTDVETLFRMIRRDKTFMPLPRFPAMSRDMSVTVDEAVPVAELISAIREFSGPLLESCRLFDIYRGPQIPENKKSASFSLSFRSPDHTLVDAEADEAVNRVLRGIGERFSAAIRR